MDQGVSDLLHSAILHYLHNRAADPFSTQTNTTTTTTSHSQHILLQMRRIYEQAAAMSSKVLVLPYFYNYRHNN